MLFKKGSKELLILAAAAFLLIAFVLFLSQTSKTAIQIQNTINLDTTSNELESANLEQIDSELNQLNLDTSNL